MTPYPMASFTTTSEARNPLIAGEFPVETKKFTLPEGNVLALGGIVGLILGAATAEAAAGNGGNGTISAITVHAGVKPGVYQIICVEPASDAGSFVVEDPDGVVVGKANVGVAFSGPIGFTVADGSNNWAPGDRILVTVAAGDDEVKLVAAASTDGSAIAHGVAAHAADATDGDVEVLVYTRGEFDATQCSVGAGLTVAGVTEALRARGVFLVPVAKAS